MNIVFIAVDTLRADHLGCYGYHRPTSPHLDEITQEGMRFTQHFATAIPTHPAFATLMTGQYSITHGVVAHGGGREIPRQAPWMPEALLRGGYTTCAVDNLGGWRVGYDRGYEFYIDPTRRRTLNINADNRTLNRRVFPWLEQHATKEPFFLFVHYWDPHTPYLPPRAYRRLFYKGDPCDPKHTSLDGMEEHPLGRTWRDTWFNQLGGNITDADYIEALYDAEIRYVDEGIGELTQKLETLGVLDDTLLVIMGDHGELMYRHNIFFDHHGLYDGNLHVPLILRGPGIPKGQFDHFSTHVDFAPTLLELAGIDPPEAMDGKSLVPWIQGEDREPPRDFIVSQECTWQAKWCLRTATHKFIKAREADFYESPERELYDLQADPDEFRNLADQEPALADTMEAQLEGWIAEMMHKNGLDTDPLIAQGISLGRAWKDAGLRAKKLRWNQ